MDGSSFQNANGSFEKNSEGILTFIPRDLPPHVNYESLIGLSSEAHTQLGLLGGLGENLPNPDLLIRPYVRREAVLSSKIEGTQASLIDIFEFEARGKIDSEEDMRSKRIQEVINYIHAIDYDLEEIKKGKPIDLDLIKSSHQKLMENVRGQDKTPGYFRTVQNWIGPEGCKIEDAIYVPPRPDSLDELLHKIESFTQDPSPGIPVLIQCALIHYQFEAIHPFADGNGRIGRLLIPLILADRHLLNKPLLYLSAYFERNRQSYYDHLLNVSRNNAWLEWIRFFLTGVIQQSKEAISNIRNLMELKSKYDRILAQKKPSGSVIRLTEYLFAHPIVTIPTVSEYLKINYPPAKNAVEKLVELGILEKVSGYDRNKMFRANEILKILT